MTTSNTQDTCATEGCAQVQSSSYRDEVIQRNPTGERNTAIITIAERWSKTGEWRFRQAVGTAALAVVSEAEPIAEPTDDRDEWITAECAVDLADACRAYLTLFDSISNTKISGGTSAASNQFQDYEPN